MNAPRKRWRVWGVRNIGGHHRLVGTEFPEIAWPADAWIEAETGLRPRSDDHGIYAFYGPDARDEALGYIRFLRELIPGDWPLWTYGQVALEDELERYGNAVVRAGRARPLSVHLCPETCGQTRETPADQIAAALADYYRIPVTAGDVAANPHG